MKVAFIFGDFSIGTRPLNFPSIWYNSRGVTGSELGVARVAQEMVKRGHDVSLFTVHYGDKPNEWSGIKLYHLAEKDAVITSDFDAVISWNEPDQFRNLPPEPVKLCSQQLNGFNYCKPDFDDFVDIWAGPSKTHVKVHAPQTLSPHKWIVIPDGCDPDVYIRDAKVPGRVVYCSSPDRGLHWLLQEWQYIKSKAPDAHLRVFYHFSQGDVEEFEIGFKMWNPHIMELGQRIRYIKTAFKKLSSLGVVHVGSVCRDQMVQEMSHASVLAYPTSIVNDFCEGFSVTVMEACAAGSAPVISDADALGELYGGVVPMIKGPIKNDNVREFSDLVIRALTDSKYRNKINKKCMEFAEQYTWAKAAEKYENAIMQHSKYKGSK